MYQFLHEQKTKAKKFFQKGLYLTWNVALIQRLLACICSNHFSDMINTFDSLCAMYLISTLFPASGSTQEASSDLRYSFCPILRKRVLQPRIHARSPRSEVSRFVAAATGLYPRNLSACNPNLLDSQPRASLAFSPFSTDIQPPYPAAPAPTPR